MIGWDFVGVASGGDADGALWIPAEVWVGTDRDPVGVLEQFGGEFEEVGAGGVGVGGLDAEEDWDVWVLGFEGWIDCLDEVVKSDEVGVVDGGESAVGFDAVGEVVWVELGDEESAPVEVCGDDIGVVDGFGCPIRGKGHVGGCAPVVGELVVAEWTLCGRGDIDGFVWVDAIECVGDVVEE